MKAKNLMTKLSLLPASVFKYRKNWFSKASSSGFYRELLNSEEFPLINSRNAISNALVNYGLIFAKSIDKYGVFAGISHVRKEKKLGKSKLAIFNNLIDKGERDSILYSFCDPLKTPATVEALDDYTKTIKLIKTAIGCKSIKVVSFDVFDTLLCRAILDPKDIFLIVSKKLKGVADFDFYKIRSKA